MNQLKIALHDTVLSRSSVDGDISIIKHDQFTILLEREIIAVNGSRCAVGKVNAPVHTFYVHDIDVVTLFVEKGVETLCGAHRNIVLRRIATADDGYVSFQIFHIYVVIFIIQMYHGSYP